MLSNAILAFSSYRLLSKSLKILVYGYVQLPPLHQVVDRVILPSVSTAPDRDSLHRLIDALRPEDVPTAERVLRALNTGNDPLLAGLAAAPAWKAQATSGVWSGSILPNTGCSSASGGFVFESITNGRHSSTSSGEPKRTKFPLSRGDKGDA
jgi:hypothetical protein